MMTELSAARARRASLFPRESVAEVGRGIDIAHQCLGDPRGEPLLLVRASRDR